MALGLELTLILRSKLTSSCERLVLLKRCALNSFTINLYVCFFYTSHFHNRNIFSPTWLPQFHPGAEEAAWEQKWRTAFGHGQSAAEANVQGLLNALRKQITMLTYAKERGPAGIDGANKHKSVCQWLSHARLLIEMHFASASLCKRFLSISLACLLKYSCLAFRWTSCCLRDTFIL